MGVEEVVVERAAAWLIPSLSVPGKGHQNLVE
jgi:hypothetical protein